MFIISGKYRGHKIKTIRSQNYRPTTSKIKESIFSILSSGQFVDDSGRSVLDGAVIIDVFGGTGALTFEAISRGAKKGIIVEKDQTNLELLKDNIKTLNFDEKIIALYGNACNLSKNSEECDIAFVDPPFNQGLISKTLDNLLHKGWVKDGGLIVIERQLQDLYTAREDCNLVFSRKYGKVWLEVLQKLEKKCS
ncbi:MAG: 16S rRNA (guanine(966)-N(2))-methyltransferase RsmD [Rickettsiales bacterium]|nr:16S rRNA (guanine(966)-N(2))-methyltransferase RsmD [Rickettsiales bacterium]